MKRVVITGGPCTGKTSLINAISNTHFTIFKEVAREVIKEQLNLNSNKVPWLDVSGFSKLVLVEQIKDYHSHQKGISVYDRGIPDILAYLNHGNQFVFSELEKGMELHRYDKVFILPPHREIYETDEERRESFESALLLHDHLIKAYHSIGYNPIEIPLLPLQERAQLLIDLIHE